MIENDLNSVHLLALRTLSPKDNLKGKAMLKNLKENATYSFCNGLLIEDGRVYLPDLTSELFDVTREQKTLRISVNAIVGENGSGKSTIIDYILRIINNLSAFILGEHYRAPGAEHLHFVYNVFAELYLTVSGSVVCVCCENERISYIKYKPSADNTYYIADQQYGFSRGVDKSSIVEKHDSLRNVLRSFCYTIVTNYSLYSLCAVNYKDDFTDYNKENRIRTIGIKNGYNTKTIPTIREDAKKRQISMDDCYDAQCWLQGLFYKNDGYQCPLVINPMRKYGHIDIQKEYKLARERMTSLLFMRDEDGKLLFNRINGKLIVESIEITKDINYSKKYDTIRFVPYFIGGLTLENYNVLAGYIKGAVKSICNIADVERDHSESIWNYIVQKVAKISYTYPNYLKYRSKLKDAGKGLVKNADVEIHEIVKDILKDHSHVTRKLYRSIYYLKYDHIAKKKSFSVEKFSEVISSTVGNHRDDGVYSPKHNDELLPPPVFYVDFNLYDSDDVNHTNKISFSTLSSGEKQITYTLSSFYYQLMNIDSSGDIREEKIPQLKIIGKIDLNLEPKPIEYSCVCAIFDEIELYYHPEMQRIFIATLIDGLKQLSFRKLKSIQILLATHSPFILSDIPRANVLFLGKNGLPKPVDDMYTFGANIHSMLRHSFFLEEGTMGKFAQDKIKDVINRINLYALFVEKKEFGKIRNCNERTLKSLPEEWQQKLLCENEEGDAEIINLFDYQYCQSIINLIQEPLLRNKLQEELEQLEPYI